MSRSTFMMKLTRKPYRKKLNQAISAIQLNLDTQGFNYKKWGGEQHCKQGDWIVDNAGDIYTIDQSEFERTYKKVSNCRYIKTTKIWVSQADTNGSVITLEGETHYQAGDYLIANEKDGEYVYAISKIKFELMYEEAE